MRLVLAVLALAALARAGGFTFALGSPVASPEFASKTAAFVFRTEGCPEPAKPQVGGTAEGLVNGARKSLPLKLNATSKPGVWAVFQNWPPDGAWVVNLKGTCNDANAGAVVPMGPRGFIRESAKLLPRAPTVAEIETSLKALASGGNK